MATEQEEEESPEEPSWFQDLLTGGPVELVDLDAEVTGWSSPLGDSFQVRGKDYAATKVKVPAGEWLLEPLALDWIKSTSRVDQVLRDPQNRVMARVAQARKQGDVQEPFVWAFNIQVPSKDHYSLVAYFLSTNPLPEGSLADRFVRGDDEFRNSRLKLIANIVKGPWIVKAAVGDHAICLLGKALTCRYVKGENFMEVDVDIGSSMVANAIVHLAINYISTIAVDLAFLLEGRTEDELPEKLLGSVRFSQLELSSAIPLEAPIVTAEILSQVESKDEEEEFEDALDEEDDGSFQSRLWKSLGQGLSVDWWGRPQQ